MGQEIKCRVEFGKEKSEGKALLETAEVLFRGGFRLKIPFQKHHGAGSRRREIEYSVCRWFGYFSSRAGRRKVGGEDSPSTQPAGQAGSKAWNKGSFDQQA